MEAENKTRTIKSAVQPAGGSLRHRTFMSILGGILSIKTDVLISSFQYEENNYMLAETLEEYALASAEAADENPGEQAPMGFMALGG